MTTSQPRSPSLQYLGNGVRELRDGAEAHELWLAVGWQDIRQRYRRTILGPWWLAISTALLVLILGLLWSEIFHVEVRTFLPFFAIGYVLWAFLSGAINEACVGFTQFEGVIKQRRIPLAALLYRIGVRHAIVFAHNAVIVALIVLWSDVRWTGSTALAVPGMVLFALVTFLALVPVAVVCTRFRDFPQIVGNVLQIAFFATPIMWRPQALENYQWVAEYNPIAHLLAIVRDPLLGSAPEWQSWAWSLAVLATTVLASAWLIGRYRHRIAYWL
jgi:lipopolysaccharide transport system permease protein